MTEKMIDITSTPEKWRDGDRTSYKFNGDAGHTGVLRLSDSGDWFDASTVLAFKNGSQSHKITDLRVTRPAPALPEEECIPVRWKDEQGVPRHAVRIGSYWYIAGNSGPYTTDALLDLIGTAEVHVANWTPLGDER